MALLTIVVLYASGVSLGVSLPAGLWLEMTAPPTAATPSASDKHQRSDNPAATRRAPMRTCTETARRAQMQCGRVPLSS
jgi:hypothetical protein